MDTREAILTRRSIRRYTEQPVDDATVKQLLEAAMAAPSANNQQPWHFIVIDERAKLDAITEFHPYSRMLKQSPLAIAVGADRNILADPSVDYWIQDCAAATENLLLAAQAMGLGACWLGIHPRPERIEGLRGLLGMPNHIEPFAVIALGWPGEEKPPGNYFKPGRIHRNVW